MKHTVILLSLLLVQFSLDARGTLPKTIAGYELLGVSIYDKSELGFSARYKLKKDEEKFDIYLYDLGNNDLGTGLGEKVKNEYDNVFIQIQKMVNLGYYSDMIEPEGGTGTIELDENTVDFLWGWTKYKQTEKRSDISKVTSLETRSSFVFLTAYEGRFLKIRYTTVDSRKRDSLKTFMDILNDFESKFSRPELPIK